MTRRWCGSVALKALEGDAEWTPKILELMAAVDTFLPEPTRDIDKPFLMPIEDVFTITGRGTVVTGRVERGIVKVGEEIEIVGSAADDQDDVYRVWRCSASCSMRAGRATTSVRCCGGRRRKMWSGVRCWRSRGAITPHTNFTAQVYILTKEEGGRHTPFFSNYHPQFYFRTTDVTGHGRVAGGDRDGDAG